MINPTLKELLQQFPAPENEPLANIKAALQIINDHESNSNAPIGEAIEYLKKFNVPVETTSEKILGLLVQSWIDSILPNEHLAPEAMAGTTSNNLEEKVKDYEEWQKKDKEIRERSREDVKRGIDRKTEIQKDLEKTKRAEASLKDKHVYATVEKREAIELTNKERELLESLKQATISEKDRKETIDVLSKLVEEKETAKVASRRDDLEQQLLARAAVVGMITQIHNPTIEHAINSSILRVVGEELDILKSLGSEDVLDVTKKSSIAIALNEKSKIFTGRQLSVEMLGENLTKYLYGPENLIVRISETRENDSTHDISLENVNKGHELILIKQIEVLEGSLKSPNPDAYIYTRIATYIDRSEAKIDTSKTIKKLGEVDQIELIIKKFGIRKPTKTFVTISFPENTWVESVLHRDIPIKALVEQSLEPTFISKVITDVSESFVVKTVESTAVKGGIQKGLTAIFAGIGVLSGPVGAFISGALAWVGNELLSRIGQWIKKNPEAAALIFGGAAFLGTLPLFGPLIALGVTSVVVVGIVGTGVTTMAVFGTLNLIRFVWSGIIISLAGPLIFLFVVLPILTSFILLIINNSAYVVPPSISNLLQNQDNLYVEVTKIAEPAGPFENSDLPLKIKYIITVKARRDALTNISFEHECKVIQENNSQDCAAPTEAPPISISPSSPYIYTYEANYNSTYTDALVTNTFTVTADAGENTSQTSSGNATITIGEPPAKCLQIDGVWPNSAKANMEAAKGKLVSGFPTYVAKVCAEYPDGLPLRYEGAGYDNYWGWFKGSHILFYPKGVSTAEDATYTLAHELVHALVAEGNNFAIYLRYIATPGILSEVPKCFYDYSPIKLEERLAETVAFIVIKPRCGNPQTQWPKHYNFVQQNIMK